MTAQAPEQSVWRWWLALVGPTLGLTLLAGAALAIDRDLSLHLMQTGAPGWCYEIFLNLDSYGHLIGVAALAAGIWLVLPGGARIATVTFAAALAGGGAANLIKLCVLRYRPRDLTVWNSVWDSFASEPHASLKLQSFPSSHTAVAFAVSAVLAAAFPRGRWLFWALAVGVAGGRVLRWAHFASDVLAGAAVGYAVGFLIAHAGARWLRQAPERPAHEPLGLEESGTAGGAAAGTSCATLPMRRAG